MGANVLSHETCHGHTALPAPAREWKRVGLCDGVMRDPKHGAGGCYGSGEGLILRSACGEKGTAGGS